MLAYTEHSYEYFLGNISINAPLKLQLKQPTVLSFHIDEADTGGSLAVELAILRPQVSIKRDT